jgi:hypothetical protein
MDAINPEYLIPGILDPPAPVDYAIPGNRLGGRFPVFTGTIYHGSTQVYAALPAMAVFGADITTFRLFQLLVGGGILSLVLALSALSTRGAARVVAVAAAGALALDPAFVLALRTQGYSCMFPLPLLLGCVLLLRRWDQGARPWLRLLAAGVLFGSAVFSYFIYAFFVPALLWLLLRKPHGEEPPGHRWGALLPWLAGCFIGYLPFVLGILLMRHNLGGSSQLIDWLRQSSEQLGATQDKTGLLERVRTVVVESRRVFTGEWPWLMILGQHRTGVLNAGKADVLILVPVIALGFSRFVARDRVRSIAVPVLLLLSFACGALVFGSRLDGQHYTAVLPLLYLAFGAGCAALWPRVPDGSRASIGAVLRGALVIVSLSLVLITSLLAQQDFHRDVRATGGAKLYSNAIDRFANHVDRTAPNATLYTPDWGFAMPLAFLSDASPVRMVVDPAEIRQGTCAGKPQLVVFQGTANRERLKEVVTQSQRTIERVTTWSQRDGVPVFQVARFAPATRCEDVTPPPAAP